MIGTATLIHMFSSIVCRLPNILRRYLSSLSEVVSNFQTRSKRKIATKFSMALLSFTELTLRPSKGINTDGCGSGGSACQPGGTQNITTLYFSLGSKSEDDGQNRTEGTVCYGMGLIRDLISFCNILRCSRAFAHLFHTYNNLLDVFCT